MIRSYHRISNKLLSIKQEVPKPFCLFIDGKLLIGTHSLHRTSISRKWRLFWRIKINRIGRESNTNNTDREDEQ